jgi:hypothetical protein
MVLVTGACLVASVAALADDAWQAVKTTSEGIALSRRPGRTSGFHDLRLEARSSANPERLATRVWGTFLEARPPVRQRDFLVRGSDEIVFHDHIKVSVVSDREYTLRIRHLRDGDVHRLVFGTAPELGPPPTDGFVTIPIVQGAWEFRPDGTGVAITYTVYSEPGGSVPAFLVRGAQVDEALENMRHALALAGGGE